MQRLLGLTALILLVGCEPSKPIHHKYELGTKVLLKVGIEAVVTNRYNRTREGHPQYRVEARDGALDTRTFFVYEFEIEKKIR